MMTSEHLDQWLVESQEIIKYYTKKIKDPAILDATNLGARKEEVDFRFFEGLFHKVEFERKSMSILDLYCGLGHVFDFAHHKGFKIGRYVGLDIVKPFVDHTAEKLPNREVKEQNFLDPGFNPDQHFDIVTCFGPLLHKMSHQAEYVEFVIEKALQFTKKYALFSFITEIAEGSKYFKHRDSIGGVTAIDEKIILDTVKKISKKHKVDIKLHKGKIYPDATEAFVQVEVLDFETSFLKKHKKLFKTYAINGAEPDKIIFDTEEGDHKAIWYNKPEKFDEIATPDEKKCKGGYYIKNNTPCYPVIVEMYEHNKLIGGDDAPLDLQIGSPNDVEMQNTVSLKKKGKWLPTDNPNKK